MKSLSLVKYSVAANSNWSNFSIREFSRQQMYFLKSLVHHIFLPQPYCMRSMLFISLTFTDKDFVLPLKYLLFSSCFLFFGASFFQNSLLSILLDKPQTCLGNYCKFKWEKLFDNYCYICHHFNL